MNGVLRYVQVYYEVRPRPEARRGEESLRRCETVQTGIQIEITGLVGVFSTPDHVIAYLKGGRIDEVRQPINICLHGRPVGGVLNPDPREASEARWVDLAELEQPPVHPAIMRRIAHGLARAEPHID